MLQVRVKEGEMNAMSTRLLNVSSKVDGRRNLDDLSLGNEVSERNM